MVVIILGDESPEKADFANTVKKTMIKPNYPEIIKTLPIKKPKGLEVENKIFYIETGSLPRYTLPEWCVTSPYVIIFHF